MNPVKLTAIGLLLILVFLGFFSPNISLNASSKSPAPGPVTITDKVPRINSVPSYDPFGAPVINKSTAHPFVALGSSPYIAAYGYKTQYVDDDISSAHTVTKMTGSASALGSNSISGGLSIHVPDGMYAQDYELQIYADYHSDGSAAIFAGLFVGCAGVGFNCGPAFWINPSTNCYLIYPYCPEEFIVLGTSYTSNAGSYGDKIEVRLECSYQSNFCSNSLAYGSGYTFYFQYNDITKGGGWHNVLTFTPSGNYVHMKSYLHLGTSTGAFNDAWHFQVGAIFSPSVPANSNWQLALTQTEYLPSGSNQITEINHATTLTWLVGPGPESVYTTYWMENWNLDDNPAQNQIGRNNCCQALISGSGSSTTNTLTIQFGSNDYHVAQNGGASLW